MALEAAACSDVGQQRKANEDCYALAAEHGLYVVADGLGGHAAGQLASELCCRARVRAIERAGAHWRFFMSARARSSSALV